MGEIQLSKGMAGVIGSMMGLLCLCIGVWAIHMGFEGRTPAEQLSPREIPGFMAFGGLFAWGGVQSIVLSLAGDKLPRWAHMIMLSGFILCLALPFLLIGILTPDQIASSVSVNGRTIAESTGGRSGGIVFVTVGVLLIVALPFLLHKMVAGGRKP